MFQGSSRKSLILLFVFLTTNLYSLIDEEKKIFYQDVLLNPMDINKTRIEYLQEILNLSLSNLILFEEYRKNNYFSSLYELTNFGLTVGEIVEISPYLTIKSITNKDIYFYYRGITKNKTINNTNTNMQIFQSELTIKDLKLYFGFKSYSNIVDEGPSKIISNSRYNLIYENDLIKAIFGHYQLSFGQNLLFGTSTISVIDRIDRSPIYKRTMGLVPYKSLTDDFDNDKNYDYINGIALNLKIDDRFFPLISMGEQTINRSNNVINFTSSFFYRESFEAGIVYNYLHSFTNSVSLFYDYMKGGLFKPYGEIAFSDGFSIVQGVIIGDDVLKISGLVFYSESNFNTFNGQNIIDYEKDTRGIFAGLRYNFNNFFIQPYVNFYFHSTNEELYQRYEIKAGIDFDDTIFSTLSFEIKSRYSLLRRTRNLRNFAYIDLGILNNRLVLELRYQNLLEFERMEMGNMLLSRLRLYIVDFFKIKGRVLLYKAKSYYSALFYPEEDFFRGDFSLNSYYGVGNEYAIFSELKITSLLTFGAGYSYDKRRVENMEIKDEHRFSLYLEGEW